MSYQKIEREYLLIFDTSNRFILYLKIVILTLLVGVVFTYCYCEIKHSFFFFLPLFRTHPHMRLRNGYRGKKWNRRPDFKSLTKLLAFYFAPMLLRKT